MNSRLKYLLNTNSNLVAAQQFCSKRKFWILSNLEENKVLINKKCLKFSILNHNLQYKQRIHGMVPNTSKNKNCTSADFYLDRKISKQLAQISNRLLRTQNTCIQPEISNSLFTQKFNSKRYFSTVTYIKEEKQPHIPVMAKEVLEAFKPQNNQIYLDMTFGAGGHTTQLLKSAPNIKILALDRDPLAHEYAKELSKIHSQVTPLLGRFSELPELLKQHKIKQNSLDGILFDFGCSSMQFDIAERGFSVSKDGPLDMRMDGERFPDMPTAADVLEFTDEVDIAKILKIYGEEKQAKKIARAIIEARYTFKRLKTTQQLADLVDSVLCDEIRTDKLNRSAHNATKTFQALRIFVNNEINEINYGLLLAQKYLKIGGHLVTITFHSLEDTIVKRHLLGNMIENAANPIPLKYSSHMSYIDKGMIDQAMDNCWEMLHKHVLVPSEEEIEMNPRSRSAKMRVAVKIK